MGGVAAPMGQGQLPAAALFLQDEPLSPILFDQ
jgi:hypothetical protein